jgi:hypothetical protein
MLALNFLPQSSNLGVFAVLSGIDVLLNAG